MSDAIRWSGNGEGMPARLRAAWQRLPGNVKGGAILVFAYFLFTFEVIAARMLGATMATEQVVLVRSAAQLIIVVPFVLHGGAGFAILRTKHLGLHVLRGTLSVVGLYFYFYSFGNMPLADATTISFTKALFLVLLAQIVLGEIVRAPRWIATIAGFLGVLLVVRPSVDGIDMAALAGIAGSLTGAGLLLVTKLLARHETPLAIMVYVAVVSTSAALIPGILVWKMPDAYELTALLLIAVFGPMGQYFNILAFRAGEASSLAAIDYVRLLYSTAAGFLLFSEIPDLWTAAGAAVIVGSTLFLTRHEARAAALVTPPAGDPLSEPAVAAAAANPHPAPANPEDHPCPTSSTNRFS